MADCLQHANANLGGAFPTSAAADRIMEAGRAAAAELTGGHPDGIAFGANMTTLNFLLAHAVARTLEPGDEIVVTELDHDANVSPWLLVARDHGLTVRTAPIRPDDVTLDHDALEALIGERTRVVAFTLASNAVGSLTDPARIAAAAHAAGALAWADAVHLAPHGRLRASELGPRRPAVLALQVLRPAHRDRRDPPRACPSPPGGPRAPGVRGAARAPLRDRHPVPRGGGRDHRRDRLPALARRRLRARRGLRRYPGPRARPLPPLPRRAARRRRALRDRRGGGAHADVLLQRRRASAARGGRALAARDIYVWDGDYYALEPMRALGLSERGGAVRAGFLHYTTEAEVDRLLDALGELAP